jgi:glycosyltransferase involved in cell wall biosynthesis
MEKENKKITLSLIAPIYNEESSIQQFILELSKIHSKLNNFELIVVDDNSDDNTHDIVEKISQNFRWVKVLKTQKRIGRGASFKLGVSEATGRFVGYMDTDGQIAPTDIIRAIKQLNMGYDIVCGVRIEKNIPKIRSFLSKGFRVLASMTRGLPCEDPLCGFKFFKDNVIISLVKFSKEEHWFFDYEIVELGRKHGYTIFNLPILFTPADSSHLSKTKLLLDSLIYTKKLLID